MVYRGIPRFTKPTVVVIFGAGGDLSRKKLFPALFDLRERKLLPKKFSVFGVSRRELSDAAFRKSVADSFGSRASGERRRAVENFLRNAEYVQGTFEDSSTYEKLGKKLLAFDGAAGVCSNKLFYLAVPPEHYEVILRSLSASGLTIPCSDREGWTRVLVEKPFGKDLETASALDRLLGKLFKEEQIFRIDHYLAKETVQSILTFRFSNGIFEPIWNKEFIERVDITLAESDGIGTRGGFYDGVGALRDVGQNHLLQLMALVAMENPCEFTASAIRPKRAKVFSELRPMTGEYIEHSVARGQYRGYTREPKVARGSKTETYFRFKAYLDNERWYGVPFYFESGKRMHVDRTEVVITFKKAHKCLCPVGVCVYHENKLVFRIEPNEGVSLSFWVKKPGFTTEPEERTLEFKYGVPSGAVAVPDAYERVLFDCIRGEQTLFASTDEVESSWRFITGILKKWDKLPLIAYRPGARRIGEAA